MTVPDLIRFLNAQAQVYSRVIADLTDGHTRTHWIWFILLVESASGEVLEVEDPAHRRPVELPPPVRSWSPSHRIIVSPIWHNEKERDAAGEPRQLVRLLGIKSGMTVADIGAGSGYYVVRLSPIVGPHGRVIAEDVVPEYLRGLRRRVRELGLQNVAISLGEPHDPRT